MRNLVRNAERLKIINFLSNKTVCIAQSVTGCGLKDRARFPTEKAIFIFVTCVSRSALGPPRLYSIPTWDLFQGGMQPEREVHHSPPFTTAAKKARNFTSTR